MVSLWYQDTSKQLMVKVIKARNLMNTELVGKADPYVKMTLWHKDQLIKKAKTDTIKKSLDPVFNKVELFDLPELGEEGLKSIKLVFTVMDKDWGKDDFIGRLVIGGSVDGSGLQHWNKVIAEPLVETEVWHPLSETGVNAFIDKNKPTVIDKKEQPSNDKKEPLMIDKKEPTLITLVK